jgi:hypothetical protein
MVFVRVIHPGVALGHYMIEVETARVVAIRASKFQKTRRPRWLFSSLYWPLPEAPGIQCRMRRGQLFVTLAWHPIPSMSMRKCRHGTFTVYGMPQGPVCGVAKPQGLAMMERFRTRTTEAIIAVSRPLCRVSMFLGMDCSSSAMLKAFTLPLIDASRCRTAPT